MPKEYRAIFDRLEAMFLSALEVDTGMPWHELAEFERRIFLIQMRDSSERKAG